MGHKNTFNPLRRLHFYAAWLITPLLITLSLSGIGFLFYTDIEKKLYEHEFFGDSSITSRQSIDEAVQQISRQYPDYTIAKISIMEDPYNNRVTISNSAGETQYIFLDRHNQIVASQDAEFTYSNLMRNFHSSLLTKQTWVRYLVELTACWTVFLIASGIYMTFKKRLLTAKAAKAGKPLRFQKLHAVLGLVIALPLIMIILTGIPWSVFMGSHISKLGQEYPALGRTELRYNPPQSDVNEIPWATRSLNQPTSDQASHADHHSSGEATINLAHQQSLAAIIKLAQAKQIRRPFSIVYPAGELGVFTVSKGSNTGVTGLDVSPYEETTAYFDQYSGELLAKIDFADYGLIGKWFTWGIPLHEGHLFGFANKILNLLVCLAFLGAIVMGFISWMKRVHLGDLNLPQRINKPWSAGVLLTVLILGVLMPLFGLSVLLILFIEFTIYCITKNRTQSTS